MIEFYCFGKLEEIPELKETQSGLKYCNLIVKANRPYANADGNFEADDYSITCWKQLAEDMVNELKGGQSLLIKGRVQANNYKKDDGLYYKADLIASSVTVVS